MSEDERINNLEKEENSEIEVDDEKLFRNLEKSMLNRAEMSQRQMDFVKGILYGLVYGIVGNMTVQFGYQVFEEWILGNFNQLFWSNLIVFFFSISVIVIVTIKFTIQIDKLKDSEEFYRKIAKSTIAELKRRNDRKANQK